MKREASNSPFPRHEDVLRPLYEPVFGWIEASEPRFIGVKNEPRLPKESTKSQWKCCKRKGKDCLRGACATPTEGKEVPAFALRKVHSDTYIQGVLTDRHCLYDAYDYDEDNAPLTKADRENVLIPEKKAVGGVVLAAAIAYVYGSCVALDGGQHHASESIGEGNSLFCDVPLAWLTLRPHLIETGIGFRDPSCICIDVGAYHSCGFAYAINELEMKDHFILADIYNCDIWPLRDGDQLSQESLRYVSVKKPYRTGVSDKEYLRMFREMLDALDAMPIVAPSIVFYVAPADALADDPLAHADVSADGLRERDRLFMQWVRMHQYPVVYLPGRGNGKTSCKVARQNLDAVNEEFGLW